MIKNPYRKRAKELEKELESMRNRIDFLLGDDDDDDDEDDA